MSNPKDSKAPAKSSAKDADEPEVLSQRKLPSGQVVRVLTDGKRVWKDAPEDSGMGPTA